jgi:hypothetical protein
MLRGLFGGKKDKDAPGRKISHAWELRPGDFLKLGLVTPEGLSGAELRVAAVHALDLGGPGHVRRVMTLDGGDAGRYTLWRDEGDALALGLEVQRPVVEQLFDIDSFARLFDLDEPPNLMLERVAEPTGLERWTTAVYRQEAALQGYVQPVDPDVTTVSGELSDDAEGIDHYRLVGDRRRFAVEVAVHDGGRTTVTLVALVTESIVEEMWPA